ncbi:MAG: hypothetical protein AAFQ67_03900, partial [Pseudomonadota bacterium]
MAELGAAVQLQDGSLYHYFPNKHAIALACHQDALRVSIRCINNARNYEGTGWQKLRHMIVCFFVESAQQGPNIYAGDLSYLKEPDRSRIAADRRRFIDQVAQFIQAGCSDGSVRVANAAIAAEAVCSILFWLPKWSHEHRLDHQTFGVTIIDAIASLLGAETLSQLQ